MLVYDYKTGNCVEIQAAQYDFLQFVIKSCGKITNVYDGYTVPEEDLEAWRKDPVFWPIVQDYAAVIAKSKGLSGDYVKSFLLEVIRGDRNPSKEQQRAVDSAIKMINSGLTMRKGFKGEFTMSPNNTSFFFEETSIDGPNTQDK